MPINDKLKNPKRITFDYSLSVDEIERIVSDKNIDTVQTASYVTDESWIEINEKLLSVRDDINIRVFGFYGQTCNLSFLKHLSNLKNFSADCLIKASNLEYISGIVNLQSLSIGIYENESFEFLREVNSNIKALYISQTKSKKPDISAIKRFKNLKTLYIEGHNKNIESLGDLYELEDLTLRSLSLNNLEFLVNLNKIWSLDIKLGSAKDLTAISKLSGLKYLELWQLRELKDIEFIASSASIQSIMLQSLPNIVAIPNLKDCRMLRKLQLENMKGLKDLSGIRNAPALEEFILYDGKCQSPRDLIPVLENENIKKITAFMGSIKKNDEIKALINKYGKEFEIGEFEYR